MKVESASANPLHRPSYMAEPCSRPENYGVWRQLLSKDASFRLIVSGDIGVKEIERLIKKLELDKEILADHDSGKEEAAN
jgi:hypothetical protein